MTNQSTVQWVQRRPTQRSSFSDNERSINYASDIPMQDSSSKSKKKRKPKKRRVSMYRMFRFAKPGDVIMIIVAMLCSILAGFLQPLSVLGFALFVNVTVDTIEGDSSNTLNDMAKNSALLFVVLGTAVMVLSYVSNYLWVVSGEKQTRRARQQYLHAILRQDISWFDQSKDESFTARMAVDLQYFQDAISEKYGALIRNKSSLAMGLLLSFVVGGGSFSIVMIVVLVTTSGIVGWLMDRNVSTSTQLVQDAYAEAGAIVEQVLSGIRTVHSFNLQERFSKLYEQKLAKTCQQGIRRAFIIAFGTGAFLLVLFSVFAFGLWYGGKLAIDGTFEGNRIMISFFCILLGAVAAIKLPEQSLAISTGQGAAFTIFEIIDRVPSIDTDSEQGLRPERVIGEIEFRNVFFQYPTRPDLAVLKDFRLKIRPGMTVALVGSSGSGKSTTIQLLQRLYDPSHGQVLLDGHDIKDLHLRWLRSQIGVVSQEPVLFNMTIRQNLMLGLQRSATQEEIIKACRKANCHSFIADLPNGYDTLVGEHGGMLSGGQKQRIAIARAILKDPPILLLDEATSALDTQSERLVQSALDTASADRTTIVIAHRLSTIRTADLIVVMHHGEVVEGGTHDQLVRYGGMYAQLVQKQRITTDESQQYQGMYYHNSSSSYASDEERLRIQNDQIRYPSRNMPVTLQGFRSDNVSLMRRATASSIDAYELERSRAKNEHDRRKQQDAPLRKMLQQVQSVRHFMILGCIGALIAGAVFPTFAFVGGKCIYILTLPPDQIAPGSLQGINLYAFAFFMFGVMAFVGYGLQNWMFEMVGAHYTAQLRAMLFRAYLRQEIGFYDDKDNSVGALSSRIAVDTKNMSELMTKVPADIMQMISTTICGLAVSFSHSWILSLIVIGLSPIMMAAGFYEAKIERTSQSQTAKAHEHSGRVAGEAIKEIRTVVMLGKQDYFESKYVVTLERPHRLAQRKAYLSSIGYALNQGFILYVAAVTFASGIMFMQRGLLEFEDIFVCLLTLMITMQGIGRSSAFATTYVKAKTAAIGVFEVLGRKSQIDPDMEGLESTRIAGDVSFENIGFCYPTRDIPVFDGAFNLKGRAGQTIALVGGSGCGKSTVVGLIQRWYDPLAGVVRLDQHNVKSFALSNLRSHVSLVSQEPILFDMSIGENIRFGVDEHQAVTQGQVEAAARAANIHTFICGLPEGYNTRVGDKGSQLSGGQKQRIAIARALIRRPKILLLDEATSALDSESEKLVQAAIDHIVSTERRTTIIIAHRLSTIQNADVICVVNNGRITEQGTHLDLIRRNGEYACLVNQQSLTAH